MRSDYGFIHEKLDIKILILFILRRVLEPISFEELVKLTMCDGGVNYFDVAECVEDLVNTGHLINSDEKYIITDKGARNGEITENSLPLSVRMLVENITFSHRSNQRRNAMINSSIATDADGRYKVALSLSDGISEVVSLELFAVSEQQAMSLVNGFRKRAEIIYNRLIEMILE